MSLRSMELEKRSPNRLSTRLVKRESTSEETARAISSATYSQKRVWLMVSCRKTATTMLMMSLETHKAEMGIKAAKKRKKSVEKVRKGLVCQTILSRGGRLRRALSRSAQVLVPDFSNIGSGTPKSRTSPCTQCYSLGIGKPCPSSCR